MSVNAMPVLQRTRGREWSDWAGFVSFIALTAVLILRAPKVGIFLLPGITHELMSACTFLMRRRVERRAMGWQPRVSAYGATFLVPAFVVLASERCPAWLAPGHLRLWNWTGVNLWLIGSLFVLWGLWRLRHSFSIEPQARELVTGGPYRFARHPIYASYILQYLGLWLGHPSLPFALALLGWLALVVWRIGYEEQVLLAAFPGYARYRQEVGMFGPRLLRRAPQVRPLAPVLDPFSRPTILPVAANARQEPPERRLACVVGRGANPHGSPSATAPREVNFSKSRRERYQRGQSLVEFAMIAPVFLFLIFGFADMSRAFFIQMDLQNAVRQAGRYASTGNHLPDPNHPGQNLSRVQSIINTAVNAAGGVQVTGIQVSSLNGGANSAGGPGDTVTISITSTLQLITPIVAHYFPNGYRFTVSASFRNEPFPPGNTL